MENTNQNNPATKQNHNTAEGGKSRHHRHRGHRGGKNHHKKESSPQTEAVSVTAAPVQGKDTQQSETHQKSQKSRHNRRHKSSGSHGYFRQPPERDSKEDEISLADLRAQIVLKAADGSIPAKQAPATSVPTFEEIVPVEKEQAHVDIDVDALISDSQLLGEDVLTPAPDIPTPIEKTEDRIEVIGVRFRTSGKMYYFDPAGKQTGKGQSVIVETARGPEFGEVCLGNCNVNKKDTVLPLRPLIRIATENDIAHNAENREKEEKALEVCREKIAQHKLDMKLIDAQYAFDNSKLLFYFSADGRVDFRDLVKDLASVFHTRIELRQIGIRDEARMLGGLGVCGRTLCCSTFLSDFAQVSIKMAKEQNLSLNSSKISGVCGRLMCCLHYEAEVYSEEIKRTPANDSIVKTEDGVGTVISSNPLAGTVRVVLKDSNDAAPKQYHRDQVTVIGKEKRGAPKNDEKSE